MKVNVEIITPIFIGSGEQYYPQDYVVLEDSLCFIDRKKFIEKIIREGLYDKFVEVSDDIDKLLGFIDDHSDESTYLECIETEEEANEKLFSTKSMPLEAFIKDKFLFKPYIPGSSLKGAMRTAILDYKIHKFWDHIDDIDKLKDKELETIIFCNENKNRNNKLQFDAKKDILKALFISDLKPIDYKLKAIKPKNRPYKKSKDNSIPIVLECLISGRFEGEMRIDKNLLQKDEFLKNNKYFKDESLSYDLIKKALNSFYKKIYDIESKRFRARFPKYEEGLMKLGKHSGAGSKSLHNLRKVRILQLRKTFDYQLSVWIDNEQNPLGWVKLEIIK